jgi:hypothetical protein
MRLWLFVLGALVLTSAGVTFAQSPPRNPSMADLDKARLDVSRLEELVREGAVARARLDQAKSILDDAEDEAILKRTLFGQITVQDLTRDQIDAMVEAAKRRVARLEPKLEAQRQLVEQGVLARVELAPVEEEISLRRQTLSLAENRARTFEGLLELMQAEAAAAERAAKEWEKATPVWRPVERYDGNGRFDLAQLKQIETAFQKRFDIALPVSALGMTELHRSMGFDHRNRVDIALTPDSPEGIWLRKYLELNRIPYFAFRSFVPGSATNAHIHIGPPSLRLQPVPASGL